MDIVKNIEKLKYVTTIGPTIRDLIEWMAKQSQSFTLNYGEDTGAWECSWIVGGQRHTAVSLNLEDAVWEALAGANLFALGEAAAGNRYITILRKGPDEPS